MMWMKDKVRQLKECVKKLDGELTLSKNISELLSDQLINVERQCWANTQDSRGLKIYEKQALSQL